MCWTDKDRTQPERKEKSDDRQTSDRFGRGCAVDRFSGRFDRNLRTIRYRNFRMFQDDRGNVELYDLAKDPGETRDLASKEEDLVKNAFLIGQMAG